jgi:uncharacterized membrane protein YdbT with pleckstrin-like domain
MKRGKMYIRKRKFYITKTALVLKYESAEFLCCCFSKVERHLQLQEVINVVVEQSWLEQKLQISTVRIQTSGHLRNVSAGELVLKGIENAEEMKTTILANSTSLKQNSYLAHVQQPAIEINEIIQHNRNIEIPKPMQTPQQIMNQRVGESISSISNSLIRIEHLLGDQKHRATVRQKKEKSKNLTLQTNKENDVILDPNELESD